MNRGQTWRWINHS